MSFRCFICSNDFSVKRNLERHLNEKRCKSPLLTDLNKLNEYIKEMSLKNGVINNVIGNNNNNNNNNINMKVEININPITKLDLSHIEPEKMKDLIKEYDTSSSKLNMLLSNYIKDIICDKEHPENHAVKYITKRPPTYNSLTEDKNGNKVNMIKGLKDTCEILSNPVLDNLVIKLKECIKRYKKDESFDYNLYEDAIEELKKELKKDNIKKALKGILQNDILNNIEMKLSML